MGETTCRKCGEMMGHITAHRTGRCSTCGADIKWCDSCNVPIPRNGDAFGRIVTDMLGGVEDAKKDP